MDRTSRVLKGAGIAGFVFFFVKGMVWLAIIAGAAVGVVGR